MRASFVTSREGCSQSQQTSARTIRIEFSASRNHRAETQRSIRAGSGGQLKNGDTSIGTSWHMVPTGRPGFVCCVPSCIDLGVLNGCWIVRLQAPNVTCHALSSKLKLRLQQACKRTSCHRSVDCGIGVWAHHGLADPFEKARHQTHNGSAAVHLPTMLAHEKTELVTAGNRGKPGPLPPAACVDPEPFPGLVPHGAFRNRILSCSTSP